MSVEFFMNNSIIFYDNDNIMRAFFEKATKAFITNI